MNVGTSFVYHMNNDVLEIDSQMLPARLSLPPRFGFRRLGNAFGKPLVNLHVNLVHSKRCGVSDKGSEVRLSWRDGG